MSQPARRSGLTKHETRRSLASFTWNFGFRGVFVTVCGGTTFVFVAFALSLGVARERMGFIASLVSFACIVQMVSLIFTTRVANKRAFILSLALAEPILMVGAVLIVPFLPSAMRVYALGGAIFLAAASLHLTKPLTDDWMAATIPAGVRGRYLGRRFQVLGIATIITTLLAGRAVEWVGKANTGGLAGILAVGGAFGILAVVFLRRATMPAVSAASHVRWADIPKTLKHRPFRRYILGMLLYTVPFFIAVPYYQVFNLDVVGMKPSFIAYMLAGYCVVKIVVMSVMGRQIDRRGARWALLATGPLYVVFFLGYALSVNGRIWPAAVAWLIAGVADGAYCVSMTGFLYGAVPHSRTRPAYFAVANLFALTTYGVGAVAAVPILEALKGVRLTVGPIVLEQFQCFYAICALLMVPCIFAGRLLSPPGRKS